MENVVNILFAVILLGWSFWSPTCYVIGYLVYVSSYLGWFGKDIIINGVEYGQFFLNLLALIPVVFTWREIDVRIKRIILILFLFYLYGLFKPIWEGHQSLELSIKASKSMTAYFFMFYALAFNRRLEYDKIFRFLTVLSVYYAVLYIVNTIGVEFRPPFYVKEQFLQCPYDSFLLLALCYQLAYTAAFQLKQVAVLSLLYIGIYLSGYTSLFVASLLVGVVILLYRHISSPLVWVFLLLLLVFSLIYDSSVEQSIWRFWENQQGALNSRYHYNEFRWNLITKEFWGGYGFLSRDTHLISLSAEKENFYMSDLSFIDAGYVDMMGRFGLVGTLLLLSLSLYIIINSLWNRQTLPFILMVLSYYAVNITWSVFTYPQGIIVLALVYAFLYNNQILNVWQKS